MFLDLFLRLLLLLGRVFECQNYFVPSVIKGLLVIRIKEVKFLFVARNGGESFIDGLGHFFYYVGRVI